MLPANKRSPLRGSTPEYVQRVNAVALAQIFEGDSHRHGRIIARAARPLADAAVPEAAADTVCNAHAALPTSSPLIVAADPTDTLLAQIRARLRTLTYRGRTAIVAHSGSLCHLRSSCFALDTREKTARMGRSFGSHAVSSFPPTMRRVFSRCSAAASGGRGGLARSSA
jgi:hypothetical protein